MRKPRYIKEGAVYHVSARMNRQEMSLSDKQIKKQFLNIVGEAKYKYKFIFRNFCIMGNHVHLDMEPLPGYTISKIMQWILSVFAIRYNKKFGYKGHVWYDRFKSTVINSIIQYIRTYLYIAKNPIRAGIVNHPLDFEFSGLTYYLQNKGEGLLDPPPKWMDRFIDNFLENFDFIKNIKTDFRYSFQDKKPGRPKKINITKKLPII